MLGLVEKDLRLLGKRGSTLVVFIGVTILLGVTQAGGFVVSYAAMLGMMLGFSTLTYDEMENGYSFLFSLPIEKKTFILEKYLICMAAALAGWGFGLLVFVLKNGWLDIWENLALLPSFYIVLALLIPIQLKFGVEHSRVIYIGMIGLITAGAFLILKFGTGIQKPALVETVDTLSGGIVFTALAGISLACLVVSGLLSLNILKKKSL